MTPEADNQNIHISHNTIVNRRMFTGIHFHKSYEIYYLIAGDTNYFIGDEIFHIHPGSVIFIPKGILHKTDSEECLTNERFLININDSVLEEDINRLLDDLCKERVVYIPRNEISFFNDLILKIESEYDSGGKFRLALMRSYISELLILVLRKKVKYAPHLTETERVIKNVSEYISENFGEDLTLAALSKEFAISKSYLSRKFKAVCGIGLNEYITYVRITKAESILKNEAASITDAASRCGFNDSNYFSSVFKKLKGITPLKYSAMYREK